MYNEETHPHIHQARLGKCLVLLMKNENDSIVFGQRCKNSDSVLDMHKKDANMYKCFPDYLDIPFREKESEKCIAGKIKIEIYLLNLHCLREREAAKPCTEIV